jgi:hypothetical protein
LLEVGAVKIYVAASGGAQEKRKEGMKLINQFTTTKIGGKTSLDPNYFVL